MLVQICIVLVISIVFIIILFYNCISDQFTVFK